MEGSQNKQMTEVIGNKTKVQLKRSTYEVFSSVFEELYLWYFIESIGKYPDGSGYFSDLFDECGVHSIVEGMKCENFYGDYSQNESKVVGPKGGLTTMDNGGMVGLYAMDIMAAAYKAIKNSNDKVLPKLESRFEDNEEAKVEITNLQDVLSKALKDCLNDCIDMRQARILFYKLKEPLDALYDAWKYMQEKSFGIRVHPYHGYRYSEWAESVRIASENGIIKAIDMESDTWNNSKDDLFYAYQFIGYMLQGYLRKVKYSMKVFS